MNGTIETAANHRPLEHILGDLKKVAADELTLASRKTRLNEELRLLNVAVETALREHSA
jgi:hypothetical protein